MIEVTYWDPCNWLVTYWEPCIEKEILSLLKTVNERVEAHNSSDEDVVKKDVAYLVKNFPKFLKFKNNGKFGNKWKFTSSGKEKKDFKRKTGRCPNLSNESLVLNVMGMAISKRNVLTI